MTAGIQREWLYGTIREPNTDVGHEVITKHADGGVLSKRLLLPLRPHRSVEDIAENNSLFKRQGMFAQKTNRAKSATGSRRKADGGPQKSPPSSPRDLKLGNNGKKVYHPHIEIIKARVAMSPYYTRRIDGYSSEVLQLMDHTNLLSENGVKDKHTVTELEENDINQRFEQVLAHTQQFVQDIHAVQHVAYQGLRYQVNEEMLQSVRKHTDERREQEMLKDQRKQKHRKYLTTVKHSHTSDEIELAHAYFRLNDLVLDSALPHDTTCATDLDGNDTRECKVFAKNSSPKIETTSGFGNQSRKSFSTSGGNMCGKVGGTEIVSPPNKSPSLLHRQKEIFEQILQNQQKQQVQTPVSMTLVSRSGSDHLPGGNYQKTDSSEGVPHEDLIDSLAEYFTEKKAFRRSCNPFSLQSYSRTVSDTNTNTNYSNDHTHLHNNWNKQYLLEGSPSQQRRLKIFQRNQCYEDCTAGAKYAEKEIPNNYEVVLDRLPELHPLSPCANTTFGIVAPLQGKTDLVRSKECLRRPVSASNAVQADGPHWKRKGRKPYAPTLPRKRVDLNSL
jgi:hypothetical protein